MARPSSSQTASSQKRSTRLSEWVTSRIVLPRRRNSANLSRHLWVKPFVADGEHLVHEQDVGIDVDRHGKTEPHVHAGRVGLDRRVDEVLELGELDDLVEPLGDLALGQAEHDAVDEDVLAAGDLRVEAGAELDEGRNAARAPSPCRSWAS